MEPVCYALVAALCARSAMLTVVDALNASSNVCQINAQEHGQSVTSLGLFPVCVAGPLIEECIYTLPFTENDFSFPTNCVISSVSMALEKCCIGSVSPLTVAACLSKHPALKSTSLTTFLRVLSGFRFCLSHALNSTWTERLRVLLTYSPFYFLNWGISEFLTKRYKNMYCRIAYPIFAHMLNNTVAMLLF